MANPNKSHAGQCTCYSCTMRKQFSDALLYGTALNATPSVADEALTLDKIYAAKAALDAVSNLRPGDRGYNEQENRRMEYLQRIDPYWRDTAKDVSSKLPRSAFPHLHPLAQKADPMNYSTAICLISDDVRGVRVSYEKDDKNKGVQVYTFKTLREHKVGDIVIVPTSTRHGFTAVRVEEFPVDIPLSDGIEYKWVVDVVDIRAYEAVLEQEKVAIEKVKSARKRAERQKLKDEMIADNPELAGLTFGAPSAGAALSPPAPFVDNSAAGHVDSGPLTPGDYIEY